MDLDKNIYILRGALKNTSGTANPRLYEDLKELISNIVEAKLTEDDMSLILKQVYWKLLGNDINIGTNPNANFLGTTTNYPLTFKVNNVRAGRLSDGNEDSSTIFGVYANGDLINNNSTIIGHHAARAVIVPGTNNVVVGNNAARNTRNLLNSTVIGEGAGHVLTDISNSVIIGNDAVKGYNEEGSKDSTDSVVIGNNIAKDAFHALGVTIIGTKAAQDWTGIKSGPSEGAAASIDYASVIIGRNAARAATGTSESVIIGSNANVWDTASDGCVFVGTGAAEFLNNTYTAFYPSVAIGVGALRSGESYHAPIDGWTNVANTAIGTRSQRGNEYGFSNVTVGYQAAPVLGSEPAYIDGWDSHAAANVIIGPEACLNTVYAGQSVFIGYRAGSELTFTPVEDETFNSNNIAIGQFAMNAKYGTGNIAIGTDSFSAPLNSGTDPLVDNIAVGGRSLYGLLGGSQNTAYGGSSLTGLTNGSGNVSVGVASTRFLTTGNYNTVLGHMGALSLTSGNNNIVIGKWADVDETVSYATTIGTESEVYFNYGVALGWRAKSLGTYSTALGTLSQAEANSISVGYNTQTTGEHSIAIGNNLNITEDNVAVIGEINGLTRVGMGTAAPAEDAALHVEAHGKGFLPPKLTTVQRDAILTPTEGLIVYNTTDHKLQCYDGSAWQSAW